jgi:hypothetical protein
VVVVGEYLHDGVGRFRLFHYNNVEDEWKQIGDSIHGQKENEKFGASLAVASEGLEKIKLAVGSPHSTHSLGEPGYAIVYQSKLGPKPASTTAPTPSPTTPVPAFDMMRSWKGSYGRVAGNAVSLSKNGRFFAYSVSQPGSEGYVESFILDETTNQWERLERLKGNEDGAIFGHSIALSTNGTTMAVGIPKSNEGGAKDIGRVRVFEFNDAARSWSQLAIDLVGQPEDEDGCDRGDGFGHSVSLSEDGTILAVGAPHGCDLDHTSIFRLEDGQFTLMGNPIRFGQFSYGFEGWSVSISSDGLIVAVGAPRNEQPSDEAGAGRVYEFVNDEWEQRGQDLLGEGRHDLFGTSISLSGDGCTVAIGSINNDNENGDNAGYVRIYQYDAANTKWSRF